MKKIIILLLCSFTIQAQSIVGAWENYHTSENGVKLKSVVIFTNGHQVLSTYEAITGKFIHSNGGFWKLEGNRMTEKVEFHTDNIDRVGKEVSFDIVLTDSTLQIVSQPKVFKRIDDGTPGALFGAWLMSGRIVNGETQSRDTNQSRKTMKILSGTRFQWIAYNTETGQFMGTGGGIYSTIKGEYTENIEFFSRDNTRVGKSLTFNYSLENGNWNHNGLSSVGNPINEVWSQRE